MKKGGNKALIIVLIIIAVLAIACGVFAYLYFCTDTLRSGQELFAKYLTQNVNELTQTVTLNKIEEVEEKLKQNKYEENITISYTEKSKKEPTGQVTIDTQNDPITKKYYGIIELNSKEEEKPLKLEYMIENDMYSLRFTNAVKQFLTIQNSNLKELAKNLGVEEEKIEKIPETINFEEEGLKLEKVKITEEEKNTEINKYSELLYNSISKEKYTKSKNAVITVNGKTITTNAYILKLSKQDLENIQIKLLETLKQDEIVLAKLQTIDVMLQEYIEESLKDNFIEAIEEKISELKKEKTGETTEQENNIFITVYEENGKTVRIKLEKNLEYITLDTTEAEGQKQIDVNYTSIDKENTQVSNGLTLIKENDNKLRIKLNNINGEEQETNEAEISLLENGNNTKLNVIIYDEKGQTEFTSDINILEEIEYKVTLDNTNNIILNDLSEDRIASIFSLVGEKLKTNYVEKFNEGHLAPFKIIMQPILSTIMSFQDLNVIMNTDFSEAEKDAFNSKFLVYEGDSKTATAVNELLNMVFKNNVQEANELTERYVVVTGDVTLGVDDVTVTKAEEGKKYKIECKKSDNGIVNEIVIRSLIDFTPDIIYEAE